MLGVFFNNWPLMLGGLLALAIPIVLHLMLKRRQQRLKFSTVRFFREQDESAKRSRRLRNLLLLSLRSLLVLMLVLAFARPYLLGSTASANQRQRHVAFVVDTSASMQAGDRWRRAVEFISTRMAELAPDDMAALVTCGDVTRIESGWAPPGRVKALIESLKPGIGRSRLAEGLTEASGLVNTLNNSAGASIVLVSDLQRDACLGLNRVVIAPEVELRVEPIPERDEENAAISKLEPAGAGTFAVTLQTHGFKARRAVKINLELSNKQKLSSLCLLSSGVETNIVMGPVRLEPGWHEIKASVDGGDALGGDDTRFLALNVPPPQSVWCVEAQPATAEFEQATFFIRSALAPAKDESPYYNAETVLLGDLPAKLDRSSPRLVVVPAVQNLSADVSGALSRAVQGGCGLIVFLGDEVRADRYNSEWRSLLPATLLKAEGDREKTELFFNLTADQPDKALFAPFLEPGSGDLSRPAFWQRFGLAPADGATVLAVFADGKPFVVAKEMGKGRVLLVNTSSGTAWNDWPRRRTFVPWIHGLAGAATGQTPWQVGAGGRIHNWGEPVVFAARGVQAGREIPIRVGAQVRRIAADATGKATLQPEQAGIHALLDDGGVVQDLVAVNFPIEESRTDFVSAAEVQAEIKRLPGETGGGAISSFLNAGRKELWQVILATGLVLLIAESLLSNRTWA